MAPATARDLGAWNIRVSEDPNTLVFRRPWDPEDQTVSVENTDAGLDLLRRLETLDAHFEEWFVGIRSGLAEDGRCILWAQVPGEAAVYAVTVADLKRKLVTALAVLNL